MCCEASVYTYDALGRLSRFTALDPEVGFETYRYDGDGGLPLRLAPARAIRIRVGGRRTVRREQRIRVRPSKNKR